MDLNERYGDVDYDTRALRKLKMFLALIRCISSAALYCQNIAASCSQAQVCRINTLYPLLLCTSSHNRNRSHM